ncbi:citrate synthase [Bacillus taeanensis]|uniref:Citrate synthase n=1 Tax=Bacillus taeanensis TaxID=273032 RepID=A0A366Y2B0_9BACI|nr:citrate synthase [Bacillus taeanensis]RBW71129.1 citrate synthase [Bacillus taeanensis]
MQNNKGLEGITATTSSVSSIIDGVLTYRGFHIDDLANFSTFEEVIYLLWFNKLPTSKHLAEFQNELFESALIDGQLIENLKSLPLHHTHPMAVLRTCISLLGMYDEEADETSKEARLRQAIRLQAKIPTIAAAYARIREGKEPLSPKKELSFAANFLYMLNGERPDPIAEKAFNKSLVLHADHELNASTFTGRVCVATLSDMYSGITAALGALKGPLHGGANERVMKMLNEINKVRNVENYLQQAFLNKQKIMGFGHRVYKNGDPRAKHLREMSQKLADITGEDKWYKMSVKIEEMVVKEKGLLPNVDFYSASVYHSLGINHDLFTPIFAISRTSGWLAHLLEQYENNRLIRPRADYIGSRNQTYTPLEERPDSQLVEM